MGRNKSQIVKDKEAEFGGCYFKCRANCQRWRLWQHFYTKGEAKYGINLHIPCKICKKSKKVIKNPLHETIKELMKENRKLKDKVDAFEVIQNLEGFKL